MIPPLHSLLLFMAAGLALNVTPGPDMLYVAARSTSEGRAAGIVSSLGIATGTLFHITAVALGLAALLAAVPIAYTAVRIGGAIYLMYLGVRAFAKHAPAATRQVARASLATIFRQGAITNILNPKVALFFLAFLPQFVDPARGSAAAQIVVLGLIFDTSGTAVNAIVALGASHAAERVRANSRSADILRKITGVIFIGLGLRIALASRR
ncbi:MAG TPA: LysE family translocator [Gemmatimonadaceae bacterium]|nr:LysE family translocator [Gemmatimonadaceae bacterium]